MSNWIEACATDEIDEEDLIRWEHDGQAYALFSHMPQSTQLKEGDSVDVSVNPADIVAVPLLALAG